MSLINNSIPLLESLRPGSILTGLTYKHTLPIGHLVHCPNCLQIERSSPMLQSKDDVYIIDSIRTAKFYTKKTEPSYENYTCLLLRSVDRPLEDHYYSWIITTDGNVRDSYGTIYGPLTSLNIVSKNIVSKL